jgi:hypothetical protein
MRKRIIHVVGLTVLLALFAAPAAHAATRFSLQVGIGAPPVARTAVAPPGYVWQPGYWAQTAYGPQWVPGAWVPQYQSGGWVSQPPQRWDRDDDRYRRDRDDRDRDRDRDRSDWRR